PSRMPPKVSGSASRWPSSAFPSAVRRTCRWRSSRPLRGSPRARSARTRPATVTNSWRSWIAHRTLRDAEAIEHELEIRRERSFEDELAPEVDERDRSRVQKRTIEAVLGRKMDIRLLVAVSLVADDRVPNRRQVPANLVFSPLIRAHGD